MKRKCFCACFFMFFLSLTFAQYGTPVPLPYLNLLPSAAHAKKLSIQTQQIIANLVARAPIPELTAPPPYVFEVDRGENRDYLLSSILDDFFVPQKWVECEVELEKYLQVNRPIEHTTRATFYLAQTMFFEGKYRQSLYKFLETIDYFPHQAQLWVHTALLKLSTENIPAKQNQ